MLTFVFGSPGAGKTCYLAKLAKKESRKRPVYCNVDIHGTTLFTELGSMTPPEGSLILLDECGIEYNNRAYKALPKSVISYLKLHRHYKVDMVVVSQSWDDIDITFRRLAERYYLIRKLPIFTLAVRCVRRIKLKTDDGLPADVIEPVKLLSGILGMLFGGLPPFFLFNRSHYFWMFDSYSRPPLPVKEEDKTVMTKPRFYRLKIWLNMVKTNWPAYVAVAVFLFVLSRVF